MELFEAMDTLAAQKRQQGFTVFKGIAGKSFLVSSEIVRQNTRTSVAA